MKTTGPVPGCSNAVPHARRYCAGCRAAAQRAFRRVERRRRDALAELVLAVAQLCLSLAARFGVWLVEVVAELAVQQQGVAERREPAQG